MYSVVACHQRARARWEDGEVSRLCALYARYGPAWAHILKEDERRGRVLAARSQASAGLLRAVGQADKGGS